MEKGKYNPNHHEPSAKTMREAVEYFKKIEPITLKALGAKDIRYFEDYDTNEIIHQLDRYNGVDSMVVYKSDHARFMANRIQYNTNYQTFTIRETFLNSKNTEYQKRKDAIHKDYIFPHLTNQVYFDKRTNNVLSMAIIKTEDLYQYIDDHEDELKCFTANNGGLENRFIVVEWHKLISSGVFLVKYENGATQHYNT